MRQTENPRIDHGEKAGFERWNITRKSVEFDQSGIKWDMEPKLPADLTDAATERTKEDMDPIEFILELSAYASLNRYSINVLTNNNKNRRLQDIEPGEHIRTLTVVDEQASDKNSVIAFADGNTPGYHDAVIRTMNHMIIKGYKPWLVADVKRYTLERPTHKPASTH
jgi:hypothetical protein